MSDSPQSSCYIYVIGIVYEGNILNFCPYQEDSFAMKREVWQAFTGQPTLPKDSLMTAFHAALERKTVKYPIGDKQVTAEVKLYKVFPQDTPFPKLRNHKLEKGADPDKPHIVFDADQYRKRKLWTTPEAFKRSQEVLETIVRTIDNDPIWQEEHIDKIQRADDFKRATTPARGKRRRRNNTARMLTIAILTMVALLLLVGLGFGGYMLATGKITIPRIGISTGGEDTTAVATTPAGTDTGAEPPADSGAETAPTEPSAPAEATAAPASEPAPASSDAETAVVRGQDTQLSITTAGRTVIVTVNVRLNDDGTRVVGTMNAGGKGIPVDLLVNYPESNDEAQKQIQYLQLPAELAGGEALNLGYFKRNLLRTLWFVPVE